MGHSRRSATGPPMSGLPNTADFCDCPSLLAFGANSGHTLKDALTFHSLERRAKDGHRQEGDHEAPA